MTGLVVDDEHTGTPEAAWLAPGVLDAVRPWGRRPPATVVVAAPHPDDEVLAAGGLLATWAAAGTAVHLVAVTDGEASHADRPGAPAPAELGRARARESAEGLRRLGVAPVAVDRLGLPDGAVAGREAEVAAALSAAVRRAGGDVVVLATWAHDGHRDHDAVGRAARTAAGATGAELAESLWWAWHRAAPADAVVPLAAAVAVPLPRRVRAARRWALGAHRSQVRPTGPGAPAVLPGPVLRRAQRPLDVVLLGAPGPGA